MSEDFPALPSHLTNEEAQYIYNVEILGLPARKAADMAGMSVGKMSAAHILQARELAKRELRGATAITKEDVVYGIRDAVGRAQILAEPMTEIVGWKEIAKLLGHDSPQKIDLNIHASLEVLQKHVHSLSDDALAKLLGANSVIDGDFYAIEK